jgi:HK97 gp10 family phage protein
MAALKTTFAVNVDSKALAALPDAMRSQLGKAVAKMARDIEAQAKAAAPVDTGYLKNSIQAKQISPLLWEVTVGANYGAFVEFGTVRRGATPYLTPAIERMRPILTEIVRQAVAKATGEGA